MFKVILTVSFHEERFLYYDWDGKLTVIENYQI